MLAKLKKTTCSVMMMLGMLQTATAADRLLSANGHTAWAENGNDLSLIDSKMDLGHWRNDIAERIFPNFYSSLQQSQVEHFADSISYQGAKLYINADRFRQLSQLTEGNNYFFTFDYDQSFLKTASFQENEFKYDQFLLSEKDSFRRSIFAPGIAYRVNENSELSLAVVFAQQNYSDINFLASEINGFDQLDLYAVSYTETSNGLGLNVGMSQKVFNRFVIDTKYQSKIDMDGFSRLLGVQADPADFDIPEKVDMAIGFGITQQDSVTIRATHSFYSDINAFVSRSYPDIFLTFLNDFESPDFLWDDHTVYSFSYEHTFNSGAVFNVEYAGRQQPPATDEDLTTILNAISAPYSVRIGLSTPLMGGELDLYASYAPKPLNFGRTDFGSVSSELRGKHTEAVLSWLFTF
jgi:hypothetical protein